MREVFSRPPWTIERVVAEIATLPSYRQSAPLDTLKGQRAELAVALREASPDLRGAAQLNAAVMLLRLGDEAGQAPLLAQISGDDAAYAADALQEFASTFAPSDSRFPRGGLRTQIPGATLYHALARWLSSPESKPGERAVFVCLKHDIARARPQLRALLDHPKAPLRLEVAQWFLTHGRDDGALDALRRAFAAAATAPPSQRQDWRPISRTWTGIQAATEAGDRRLKTDLGALACEVLERAVASQAFEAWVDVNAGFVDLASAARVIGRTAPPKGRALLMRLLDKDLRDYVREAVVLALADLSTASDIDFFVALLADPATRIPAAKAIGRLGAGTSNAALVERLAVHLSDASEERVVDALLDAIVQINGDGSALVASALERTTPWTRHKLKLRLAGLSARELADLLTEAGAMDPASDDALDAAAANELDLMSIVWAGGERVAQFSAKISGPQPDHHLAFQQLIDITRPPIAVSQLREDGERHVEKEPVPGMPGVAKVTDLGARCTVSFEYNGVAYAFDARPSGRWMDATAVIDGFNGFMAEIGRPDRCFQLDFGSPYCVFIVAHEQKFRALVERLAIPLEKDPTRAARDGAAFVRKVMGDVSKPPV